MGGCYIGQYLDFYLMIKEENKQAEHDDSYFLSYKWAFNDLFDNKLNIFQFESKFRN